MKATETIRNPEYQTRSQRTALKRIRNLFQSHTSKPLARFEVTPTEYKDIWVRVESTDNPLTRTGIFASIGVRGKIEIFDLYDCVWTTKQREELKAHYLKMLKPVSTLNKPSQL